MSTPLITFVGGGWSCGLGGSRRGRGGRACCGRLRRGGAALAEARCFRRAGVLVVAPPVAARKALAEPPLGSPRPAGIKPAVRLALIRDRGTE